MGKPLRIVVGKAGRSISVLPNQRLKREIHADSLRSLHQQRGCPRIAKDQNFGRSELHTGHGRRGSVINTRMIEIPRVVSAAASRSIVSFGPNLLPQTINPSGVMACIPPRSGVIRERF